MWLALATTVLLTTKLLLGLGSTPVGITLVSPSDVELSHRLDRVASDPDNRLLLRLGHLEAVQGSAVSWEVHAVPASSGESTSPESLVGVLSMYGVGPSTEFVYILDAAIARNTNAGLRIVFMPVSGLDQGSEAMPLDFSVRMTIGTASIEVEHIPPPTG